MTEVEINDDQTFETIDKFIAAYDKLKLSPGGGRIKVFLHRCSIEIQGVSKKQNASLSLLYAAQMAQREKSNVEIEIKVDS